MRCTCTCIINAHNANEIIFLTKLNVLAERHEIETATQFTFNFFLPLLRIHGLLCILKRFQRFVSRVKSFFRVFFFSLFACLRANSNCEQREKNDNKFESIRGCLWPKRIVMITNDVYSVREPKHFICHLNVNRKESIDKLYTQQFMLCLKQKCSNVFVYECTIEKSLSRILCFTHETEKKLMCKISIRKLSTKNPHTHISPSNTEG